MGHFHYKRITAFQADQDISVESNQYNFQIVPGKEQVYAPMYLVTLKLIGRIAEKTGALNPEDMLTIQKLETQLKTIIDGGRVGKPRAHL